MAQTDVIRFRVKPEEKGHLQQAAVDAGFENLSEYLRRVVLERTVVAVKVEPRLELIVIPSTATTPEQDELMRGLVDAVTAELNRQAQSPPPAAQSAPEPPASVPTSEPAVGVPAAVPPPAAGTVSADQPCPSCGARGGQHQPWCEVLTGESPVPPENEADRRQEQQTQSAAESFDQFIDRRVSELEGMGRTTAVATAEAQAEWEAATTAPAAAPATEPRACPACGTVVGPQAQVCPTCSNPIP